jgi:hypothetical protein
MQVERVRPGAIPAAGRKTVTSDGFSQYLAPPSGSESAESEAADQAAATASLAPTGGLMTYEAALDRVRADRQARRHGRAMLQALGALQVSLLAGGDAASQALADLASHIPDADDPVLRLILREIGVRAAVELARHPPPANISIG